MPFALKQLVLNRIELVFSSLAAKKVSLHLSANDQSFVLRQRFDKILPFGQNLAQIATLDGLGG